MRQLPSSFGDISFSVGLKLPSDTFDEPLFIASVRVIAEYFLVPIAKLRHGHVPERCDLFGNVDCHEKLSFLKKTYRSLTRPITESTGLAGSSRQAVPKS
jgi:hypothetical protein